MTACRNWTACTNSSLTNQNIVSLTIDGSGKLYAGTGAGVFMSTTDCSIWRACCTNMISVTLNAVKGLVAH